MNNQFTATRPLPWRTTDNGSGHDTLISDAQGLTIASAWAICEKDGRVIENSQAITDANARLIVKAVNERDELLKLVEKLTDLTEAAIHVLHANIPVVPGVTDEPTLMGMAVKPVLDRAHEILREAEHA